VRDNDVPQGQIVVAHRVRSYKEAADPGFQAIKKAAFAAFFIDTSQLGISADEP